MLKAMMKLLLLLLSVAALALLAEELARPGGAVSRDLWED